MEILAGGRQIDIHQVYEAEVNRGTHTYPALVIRMGQPAAEDLAALMAGPLEVNGRPYSGYDQLAECSLMLFKQSSEAQQIEELAAQQALLEAQAQAAAEEAAAAALARELALQEAQAAASDRDVARAEAAGKHAKLLSVASVLPDELAMTMPEIYPELTGSGEAIEANTRINWKGEVAKAKVTLWDRADSWPDAAPELWDILRMQGPYREIPEVITAELAFAPGEIGWWKGVLKQNISGVAMVHNPDVYPQGWKDVPV